MSLWFFLKTTAVSSLMFHECTSPPNFPLQRQMTVKAAFKYQTLLIRRYAQRSSTTPSAVTICLSGFGLFVGFSTKGAL